MKIIIITTKSEERVFEIPAYRCASGLKSAPKSSQVLFLLRFRYNFSRPRILREIDRKFSLSRCSSSLSKFPYVASSARFHRLRFWFLNGVAIRFSPYKKALYGGDVHYDDGDGIGLWRNTARGDIFSGQRVILLEHLSCKPFARVTITF